MSNKPENKNESKTTIPNDTITEDWKGKPWAPDKEIEKRYRRAKGDKAGSKVKRQCRSCLYFNIPMPDCPSFEDAFEELFVQDKKGKPTEDLLPEVKAKGATADNLSKRQPCRVLFHGDGTRGPVPSDYRCGWYVHREWKPMVQALAKDLPVGQVKIIAKLGTLLTSFREVNTVESIKSAIDWILAQDVRGMFEVTDLVAGEYVKTRRTKVDVDMHVWYNISTSDGMTFQGLSLSNTARGVAFSVPNELQKTLGKTYTVAPELFGKQCVLVDAAEEGEEDLEDVMEDVDE